MFNTGQMLLVLGAIVLFSIILPSLNQVILYNDVNIIVTRVENSALALAQGYLSEAATKEFDEVCLTSLPLIASQLTPVANLGSESGEYYPNFDDLDDYVDLSLVDSTTFPSVSFTVTGAVDYIDPDNPETTSGSPTFVKRLRITVTSSYLVDPVSRNTLQITLERLYAFY